ncbi:MAG: glutathione S-transferase family protein [Alphaproteobacteria bacterium]|nr:glutathione S-transferase family protein [Alphaproteobacteria bacterium]
MNKLYHYLLCPHSRKCRLMLGEIKIEYAPHEIRPVWNYGGARDAEFLRLNPSGEVPVLVLANKGVVAGHYALTEWIIENDKAHICMPDNHIERAEVRRLVAWFDTKFMREVGVPITDEKINNRLMGKNAVPNMEIVRQGLANLGHHLSYLQYLLAQRDWLAGAHYTLADMAAAAPLSCLDYTGDVAWKSYPLVREWYARIKSRPSFRPLLADYIAGFRPTSHYADLDF